MRKMKKLKITRKKWLRVEEKEVESTNDTAVDLKDGLSIFPR